MRLSVLCALAGVLVAGASVVGQRRSSARHDLEGTWSGATLTLYAVECHEGNYAIENFLRGARAEERVTGADRGVATAGVSAAATTSVPTDRVRRAR